MAQKESCIAHEKSGTYVKIRESYLNLCIYMVKSAKREPTIKRNDCAAALLAYYEHRHNALLAVQQDKKVTPDDMFMESSMSFIERGMMYLYSQNSIREANDMLERRGFITTRVRRNPDNSKLFLPTEVRFNPDRVNEVLPLLKIEPTSKMNKVSYFKNEVPLLQFYREELYSINNTIINNKEVSVVTDTPPLATDLSSTEIPNNCQKEKTEKPINLESVKTETFKKEKEKSPAQKEKDAGGEKLDIDAKIAPLGMSVEKLDFIFLEASRIDTPEIRAKFIEWHVRRAKETKGVRTCLHYQKIMREIANSDLEVWEVLQGFTMAYEACWQGIKIEWVKNRTRDKKQQNGTNQKQPQQPFTPKYATGI